MWAPVSSGSAAHPPLHGATVGSGVGSPPAWSPAAPRAPLYPPGLWGQCQALATLQEVQQLQGCEAVYGFSCCCPEAGREGASPTREGAGLASVPALSPCHVCQQQFGVSLMVRTAEKSRSSPAADRGWRQLHHNGSLQPPCDCSLPAQAQTSLKLIPPRSLGLLGLLSCGHRSSLEVQAVFFP